MSCDAVKKFLSDKEQLRKNEEATQRYKILSHYELGYAVKYNGQGDINDYPIEGDYGSRFKFECDISDEDFEKIKAIYEKEMKDSVKNDGAEKTLNVCATILVILGFITLIATIFVALSDKPFNWGLLGLGMGVFFFSVIETAFANVIVNISNKLNK